MVPRVFFLPAIDILTALYIEKNVIMYTPIDFNLKGWCYYPPEVKEMMKSAQILHLYKRTIRREYKDLEFGEYKTRLYNTLIEIESIVDEVKKVVRHCETLNLKMMEYAGNRERQEELKRKLTSIKSSFSRIEKVYTDIKLKEL